MTSVALTIAGSDPSGGAGIQSDLRTFAALGVVGLSVITALTVQNSQGVQSVHPVAPDVLAAQLEAVFSDTHPHAVKIGMLGTAAHVRVVADALRRFEPPNVVLDPVLASTGGIPLLDEEGRLILLNDLLPLCDLVTPNLDEAKALTGLNVTDRPSMKAAAQQLQSLGARYALVKGGHLHSYPCDVLPLSAQDTLYLQTMPEDWIDTPHSHGTGCLLSASIAAFLASGLNLRRSALEAKRIVVEALRQPVVIGQERGYPNVEHAAFVRLARIKHERLLPKLHGIYVVTDAGLRPGRTHVEVVHAALAGGAKTIQLRDKQMPSRQIVALAKHLRQITRKAGVRFIVNDRVDVALACDADGVHLGPDDISPEEARKLLGHQKLIGVSVGTVQEANRQATYASYFGVGAIFGSMTKSDAGPAVGLDRICEIKTSHPKIPIVAIGGINAENIAEVAAAGADAAAVVSAVVSASDMEAATRELRQRFEACSVPRV